MKRFYSIIFILAAAALALTACDTNDLGDPETVRSRFAKQLMLHATISDGQATKTAVQANGTSVYWTPGDQLSVFYGASYSGKFTSLNTEPAATADFAGSLDPVEGAATSSSDAFWAVYPYNAANFCDGQSVTFTLSDSQLSADNTFAEGVYPAVARSSDLNMRFHNVFGGACFKVATEGIRAVTFKSLAGESLAGTVKVTMGADGLPEVQSVTGGVGEITVYAPNDGTFTPGKNYYAVMIPQTLAGGLKITYRTQDKMASTDIAKSLPVVRGQFGILNGYDAGLTFEAAPVDGTSFPDKSFRSYVFSNFDKDGDGVLSESERNEVTQISVCTDTIASVKGIEHFPNLKNLYCSGSRVYNQQQGRYDVNGRLTSIDVSENTALEMLYCFYNPLLTELDVSGKTSLVRIDVGGDGLTSLNVSGCSSLQSLVCWGNAITELDVTTSTALTNLSCYSNRLSVLDVSNNTALTVLNCSSNQLTALDVSASTELVELSCYNNKISSLDVSMLPNLSRLYVYYNTLGTLDVSHNPLLTDLDCESTGITALNLSSNPQLSYLYCANNAIESLDLSNNPALESLYAQNMRLKEIDLSSNPVIRYLNCSSNPMEKMYILVGQPFRNLSYPSGIQILSKPAQAWSVIGDFNGWASDVDMVETSTGIWVSPAFDFTGPNNNDVKIRQDHGWMVNLGGVFQSLDTPFGVSRDGENIALPGGKVVVTLDVTDPLNPTVTVSKGTIEAVPSNQIWYTSSDGSVIDLYTASNDPTNVDVVSNTYQDGKGVITFDGTLTRLGQQAFANKSKLTSIQLPSSLEFISAGALSGTSLTQIDIPENVSGISNGSLAYNSKLQRVYVPQSLVKYGDHPFADCPSLSRFEGPYATADGRGLVYNNRFVAIAPAGLTSYSVPEGVERILLRAFYKCTDLTSVNLPSSLKYINGGAFQNSGITSITIPEGIQSIGWSAFSNCSSLTSVTCLAPTPPTGGDGMFDNTGNCPIYVPEAAVDNYKAAEYWSQYADRIYAMPSAFWSVIGAFSNWESDIDMTETSKGVFVSPAFNYAAGLTGFKLRKDHAWDVNIGGTFQAFGQPFAAVSGGDNIVPDESGKIVVTLDVTDPNNPTITVTKAPQPNNEIWYTTTDGLVASLRSNDGFGASLVSNSYQNGLGVIEFDGPVIGITGSNPFVGTNVDYISLPETAVSIKSGFEGCDYLASVSFPSHLECVPSHLFAYNEAMSELFFPETDNIAEMYANGPIASVYNLSKVSGPYATADNRSLIKNGKLFAHAGAGFSSYAIPNGVVSIGPEAFLNYKNLTEITVPNSVESIGYLSFTGTGITHIDLPESISFINSSAFKGCKSLLSIYIPANAEIAEEVFDGCVSLSSFTGRYASEDNRLLVKDNVVYAIAPGGITSYSIPEGITGISSGFGYEAYLQLESLELPSTLTDIRLLRGNRLKTLVVKAEVPPTVQFERGLGMNNIEAIYVPAASVSAYKTAQNWSAYADKIQPIASVISEQTLSRLTNAANGFFTAMGNVAGYEMTRNDSLAVFNAMIDFAANRYGLAEYGPVPASKLFVKYCVGTNSSQQPYLDSMLFHTVDFSMLRDQSNRIRFAPDGTEVGAFENILSQMMSPSFKALFTKTNYGVKVLPIEDKNIINENNYNAFLGFCRWDNNTSTVVQLTE